MSISRHLARLVLIVGLISTTSAAKADLLFSNPPDFPGGYDSDTSQSDTVSGFLLTLPAYSSFTLANPAQISSVDWQGVYVSSNLAQNPPAADSASFTVSIYANVGPAPAIGGVPGATLYTNTSAVGPGINNVQENFVADVPFNLGFTTPTFASVYNYTLNLAPETSSLAPETYYWLSVVANTTNGFGTPYWGWNSGGTTNGPTYLSYDTTSPDPLARTFSLYGSAVPEPSDFIRLLGLALTGSLALAWRRRKTVR